MTPRRSGIVLIATLILILALALLTAGLILAANETSLLARARVSIVQARYASEAAAADALADWSTRRVSELRPQASLALAISLPPGSFVTAQQLGSGLYLVSARGTGQDERARAWSGVLVRTPQLRELWQPFGSALATGGQLTGSGARIDARAPTRLPPAWSAAECPDAIRDSLTEIFGDTALVGLTVARSSDGAGIGDVVAGQPPIVVDSLLRDSTAFRDLGPLTTEDVAQVADRTEAGSLVLAPRIRAGVCDNSAPGNWGDPLDRASPCAQYFPLIYAPGDLTISGAGQGVLVVTGNLSLQAGAQFYGPILAAGSLTAARSSAIVGAVRVGGRSGESKLLDATITYSACTLYNAFRFAPALDRAFRPRGRWWIPLF
jgi:hypothetical protein